MRNKITLAMATVAGVLFLGAGVAGAQEADPTESFNSSIDGVSEFVTGTAAPKLYALAAVVVLIGVGLAYIMKSRKPATKA